MFLRPASAEGHFSGQPYPCIIEFCGSLFLCFLTSLVKRWPSPEVNSKPSIAARSSISDLEDFVTFFNDLIEREIITQIDRHNLISRVFFGMHFFANSKSTLSAPAWSLESAVAALTQGRIGRSGGLRQHV